MSLRRCIRLQVPLSAATLRHGEWVRVNPDAERVKRLCEAQEVDSGGNDAASGLRAAPVASTAAIAASAAGADSAAIETHQTRDSRRNQSCAHARHWAGLRHAFASIERRQAHFLTRGGRRLTIPLQPWAGTPAWPTHAAASFRSSARFNVTGGGSQLSPSSSRRRGVLSDSSVRIAEAPIRCGRVL